MKMIHMNVAGYEEATLEGYILDHELMYGQENVRPAIVICPGGGYLYCSPREAEPVALAYAAQGFHAFILRYSTGRDCAGMKPLKEVDWVIGYLREHAEEWHIDPDKILTCGFSAGGHLALSAGVLAENKPNGMILGYPAAFKPAREVPNFMFQLLMGKEELTDEDLTYLDLVEHIGPDAPPVFLVATADDGLTTSGALAIANKYAANGRKYELHIFQHGPHGYSLGIETSADGSSRMMNREYAQWLGHSVEWLKKVFGQPEFVDKETGKMMEKMKELGIKMPQL